MNISELHIGQEVILPNGRGPGVVTRLGTCYWPGCRYGNDCVAVRPGGNVSTMNFRAAQLEPVGGES